MFIVLDTIKNKYMFLWKVMYKIYILRIKNNFY